MRNILIAFLMLGYAIPAFTQTSKDYAVMLTAEVVDSPAQVILNWPPDNTASEYRIFRKRLDTDNWGSPLAQLPSSARSYTDIQVERGQLVEYYVQRIHSNRVAHGYLCVGMQSSVQLERSGLFLLLVDENYKVPLATEIEQLRWDIIKDGWECKVAYISRSASPVSVKSIIQSHTSTSADEPKLVGVYLLGRIPVPYSGGFEARSGQVFPPDGHSEHGGAWPTDMYYAYPNDAFWTDTEVNDTTPARTANDNIPGDGKFDQMFLEFNNPNYMVGRVDLTQMPAFGKSDTLLVKQYLQKAHAYKSAETEVIRRGLVDDHFGAMNGEAFAASGWRNFSALFGDSVFARDYVSATKQGNYLFTYGCGAGSYTSCSGVATTSQFTNDSISQIFTMLFGSYFGDWDSPNNLLRAPLASKNGGLANAWSGRPHWHVQHMAMGFPIGYSTQLTQGNIYDNTTAEPKGYVHNICPTFISVNLMGDPTLRLHMRKPVTQFTATPSADTKTVILNWQPVTDAIGYAISKMGNHQGNRPTVFLNKDATEWTDSTPYNGYTTYLIRPIYEELTPSGTYLNTALAAVDSALSTNTVGLSKQQALEVKLYPNPSAHTVYVYSSETHYAHIEVTDLQGKIVYTQEERDLSMPLPIHFPNQGIYFIRIFTDVDQTVRKVVIH